MKYGNYIVEQQKVQRATIGHRWLVVVRIRKALLTQRWTRNSGARLNLKAQWNKISCQKAPDDRRLNIYSVLLVLTRRRHLSRSVNAVSAENRKFSQPLLI